GAFGWEERAKLELEDRDLPFMLTTRDAGQIPAGDRRGFAFLLGQGILSTPADGSLKLRSRPTHAMVLSWIYRIVDRYQSIPIQKGMFRGLDDQAIQIGNKETVEKHPLAPVLVLYR